MVGTAAVVWARDCAAAADRRRRTQWRDQIPVACIRLHSEAAGAPPPDRGAAPAAPRFSPAGQGCRRSVCAAPSMVAGRSHASRFLSVCVTAAERPNTAAADASAWRSLGTPCWSVLGWSCLRRRASCGACARRWAPGGAADAGVRIAALRGAERNGGRIAVRGASRSASTIAGKRPPCARSACAGPSPAYRRSDGVVACIPSV